MAEEGTSSISPLVVPDLVAFWDFQNPVRGGFRAAGENRYKLRSRPRLPAMVQTGGLFGPRAVEFKRGTWLECPRMQCPELNISGKDAQVTVVAWILWRKKPRCQFIAGMWDETNRARQYGLFVNLSGRYGSADNVHAHVSASGGPTDGDACCVTYATGASPLALDRWHTVAMSYDGQHARAYVDGGLDTNERRDKRWGLLNPFSFPDGLHDGGSEGADFTVGAVDTAGKMSNWFHGLMSGLAVYRRALDESEIRFLHRAVENTAT
ncbi:MAG: hypothetical protein JJU00_09985 [Opitutales bacterium]|nr:hypothetical protein [Opitutales bacterium]